MEAVNQYGDHYDSGYHKYLYLLFLDDFFRPIAESAIINLLISEDTKDPYLVKSFTK